MSATYYKCTTTTGRTLTSRVPLPVPNGSGPGAWAPDAAGDLSVAGGRGYSVATMEHLPLHLGPVMWRVETANDVRWYERVHVARSVRLVERVGAWTPRTATRYAYECVHRAVTETLAHVLPGGVPGELEEALRMAARYADGLNDHPNMVIRSVQEAVYAAGRFQDPSARLLGLACAAACNGPAELATVPHIARGEILDAYRAPALALKAVRRATGSEPLVSAELHQYAQRLAGRVEPAETEGCRV